ncbi:MAG: hypothetical protein K2Q32_09160 [Alphaproteobacteria bacterium]|nr:hypothetical protein [Alphaproteobacteria bacterium]
MADPKPPFSPTTPNIAVWNLSKDNNKERAAMPERLLYDAVERMGNFRDGRVAVHVHFSKLQHHNRRDHYLRIAADNFENNVKSFAGHIFQLSNGDLFYLGKDVEMHSLIEAVDKLRVLFSEDPLAQYHSSDEDSGGFASYYDFEENYDLLHQDVLILYKSMERLRKSKEATDTKIKPAGRGKPFVPGDLSKLISILVRADLTNIIRRQTACVIGESGIPKPFFQEAYVSIDDLQKICTPDIDLLSDRWLFHYLTRTLDKRVLTLMANGGINPEVPFSINLNIQTLLSPEFSKFDALVPAQLRGKTVIEIHKVDVFSDVGAFIFARDFLRERGYLLCLDGLTQHTLPFFDKNKMGLDFFKVFWAPDGLKTANAASLGELKNLVAEFGEKRIILCRCDSEDAITVGRELGITQFQGHMIDRLLGLSKTGAPQLTQKKY